jgi:Flp pilus assembly protein protease CpaA
VETILLMVAIGILAIVAYRDVRSRRIPNTLSLAIAMMWKLLASHKSAVGYWDCGMCRRAGKIDCTVRRRGGHRWNN